MTRSRNVSALLAGILVATCLLPLSSLKAEGDNWLSLRKEFFADRPILDQDASVDVLHPFVLRVNS